MKTLTEDQVLKICKDYNLLAYSDSRLVVRRNNDGFYINDGNNDIQFGKGYQGLKQVQTKLMELGEVGDPKAWEAYKVINSVLNSCIDFCLDHGLKIA